ncbi:MAG: hypothetical protein MPJ50_16530 [Pirellulales bacterium]|nr:hypothetical protein [Pirellulales bacterium]
MASPFDPFRKRQKAMIAVVAVLCMFAFVFASADCDFSGSSGRGSTVVEIYGKTLNEVQWNTLLDERRLVLQFVGFLRGDFSRPVFPPLSERAAVNVEATAVQADAMGIIVSDDAINRFIDDNNFLQHSQSDIEREIGRLRTSSETIFRALRRELMAAQAERMFLPAPSNAVVSPARLWDYYLRLHRRAKVNALAVNASDFLDQVEEPSTAELEALFEQYKNAPLNPFSPEPGFSQPARATVHYIKAEYQKFYDQAESELTEEELKEYYENQKETQFQFSGFVPEQDTLVAPTATDDPVPGTDNAEKEGDGQEGGDQKSDASADQAGGDDASGGDVKSSASGDGGNTDDRKSGEGELFPISFTSDLQNDASQDDATQGTSGQGDTNQGDANQTDANQGAAGEQGTVDQTGTDETIAQGEESEQDNRSVEVIADEFRLPNDILDGPDPEFDPFWKVRKEILDKLANDRAVTRIEEAFAAVRAPLDAMNLELSNFRNRRSTEDDVPDPNTAPRRQDVETQVANLAQLHGLEFVTDTAEDMTQFEFAEIEELQGISVMVGNGAQALFQTIFGGGTYPFDASEGSDADGNNFLVWKTKERKAFTPEGLSEVNEHVVEAWRLGKARELAKEKAEEIAAACKDGKVLKEFATDDNKVNYLAPFTWVTQIYDPGMFDPQMIQQLFSQLGPPYRETAIDDLERVGSSFMEATFSLEEGETGVAPNEPETVFYVVEIERYDYQTGLGGKTVTDARRDFLLNDPSRLAYLYGADYEGLRETLFLFMNDEEDVKWFAPER